MIPKTIHYCWFGRGEKPKLAEKCIASWRKYCPDYEIIEWNEDNFDVSCNQYVREAYAAKKYAFVSDYARFKILYEQGGLYFDTDVELIRSIDDIVERGPFMGIETQNMTAPGLGLYKEIIDGYDQSSFYNEDGTLNLNTVVPRTSAVLRQHGLDDKGGDEIQFVAGVYIYPIEYFNPYDDATGRLNITENTRSIRWYSKSWLDKKTVLRSKLTKPFHRLFGTDCFSRLRK